MTGNRTYAPTVAPAALYVALCWIIADGVFRGAWWDSEATAGSVVFTYFLLALIISAVALQALRLPATGMALRPEGVAAP